MSEKKLGDSSRTSKYSINPKNWSRKSTSVMILITILTPFFVVLGLNMGGILGAFQGFDVQDETYHIGFYTLEFEFMNTSRDIEDNVDNITVDLLNYYTNEIIEEDYVMNSDTIYETTNVTLLYFKSVNGIIDPNAEYRQGAYLIYTNEEEENALANIIFENPKGKDTDFDLTIFKKENSTETVYGDLNVADIYDTEFELGLSVKNTGNGTFGDIKIIPEAYRYNINISNSGFWWKFDCIVNNVTFISDGIDTYNTKQDIYYDYAGNSYMMFPRLYAQFEGEFTYRIECESVPTNFEFIQGQWNGDVILSLS